MLSTTCENQILYAPAEKAPGFDTDRAVLLGQWLQTLLPIKRSLDIGCAGGGFSTLLPKSTEKWGLDFECHPDLPETFKFFSCDISQAWPVPAEHFEVVLAGEIIEHMLDTDLFLQRCFRALKPGGHLLLTTPNLASFANLRLAAAGQFYVG
jgi:2-polyprenyl-3-methyl-5-hydroxy-6-metoxy-1,4-benzoquinol methylase